MGETARAKKSVAHSAKEVAAEYQAISGTIELELKKNSRVRVSLPGYGRLHIDRQLPFLTLYRRPEERSDAGTDQLVTGGAAYLCAPGKPALKGAVSGLIKTVCQTVVPTFGRFLLIEVWSRPEHHQSVKTPGGREAELGFRIFTPPGANNLDSLLGVLARELRAIEVGERKTSVQIVENRQEYPGRMRPILSAAAAKGCGCVQVGLEIEPAFRSGDGETIFPPLLRILRRRFGRALDYTFYHFANQFTTDRPKNFHSLGRRAVSKSVWDVDRRLDKIASSFDFVMEANPVNVEEAWRSFHRSHFDSIPRLRYRPLPIDPPVAKRELFSIPIDRIEDPTFAHLFFEKQAELDRHLTMLSDRGTERFLFGSIQLYGRVSPQLMRTAEEILERIPSSRQVEAGRALKPEEFRALAEEEFKAYRKMWEGFAATSSISPNVVSGLMVSSGNLLISNTTRTPGNRANALIQHEVGTHLVTYYNGSAQRLTILRSGLAGYEELQEGLAVLAEYLVKGITPSRLRTLAGRVIAARMINGGATFSQRAAFNLTIRIYRGGGLTKDLIYLRGFLAVLDYLKSGGELKPLYAGKIAAHHTPVIQELRSRHVLSEPKLMPTFLELPECQERLDRLREGLTIDELLT